MKFEDYNLPYHGVRLSEFKVSEEDYKLTNINKNVTNIEFLRTLACNGLDDFIKDKKINPEKRKEYLDRVNKEIETINLGGFIDYILLIWDIINFAKKNNIPYGNGRGSAAGSLVLYLIGVTKIVDPIKYGLYFERFLSKARFKKTTVDGIDYLDGSLLADVDLDFSNEERHKVVEYLFNKYQGKSCKLSTFSTLSTKILIKECGKIVGNFSEEYMNNITKTIESIFGKVQSIEATRENSKEFDSFCKENQQVLKVAKKLKSLIKATSSHASGYLVSYYPLEKNIPVQLGTDGEIVSSYDMNDAQKLAIKVDLLGLQDLTLLSNVCKRTGINPDYLDYEDKEVYKQLENIETPYGIFQLGADAAFRGLKKIKPKNFEHLMAVSGICRPGSFQFTDKYAEYVEKGYADSYDENLDKVFGTTANIAIYQESLMKCAHEIFGLTLEEAEILRRAVGKKKKEEMLKFESLIFSQAKKLNLPEETAKKFWDILLASADYSFNLSHCCAYTTLSFLSLYLKFKHPKEFFIEALRSSQYKADPISEIATIQKELVYFNIKLLPPDIVKSDLDFKIEGNDIRYGLSSIKGVSEKTFEKLKEFINSEKTNKFEVFNAAQKSKLNIGVFSALIQAGTLGSMGSNRPRLVFESQLFNLMTDREKAWCIQNGGKFNYDLFDILKNWDKCLDSKAKQVFKESRIETLRKKADKYREIFKQNSQYPDFAAYIYERKLTGFCYSQKLKNIFEKYSNSSLDEIITLKSLLADEDAKVCGFVKSIEKKTSKNQKKYAKMMIEDETGEHEILLFEPRFSEYEKKGIIPKEESIVMCDIRKWNDACTIQNLRIFDDKIYLKLADLKNNKTDEENN